MKLKISSAIIIMMVVSIFFGGCEDYLQQIPPSSYSAAGFYKTQADFEQAVAAVYGAQQSLYTSNACWYYGQMAMGDETRVPGYLFYGLDNATADATNSFSYGHCNIFWRIINRANTILDKIDPVTFTTAGLKDNIKGECLLLRGWSYWSLGWQYGGVPLINKSLPVTEVMKIKRSTKDETLAFAEADYLAAIQLLPEAWTGSNIGRATKYSAMGVLARLYMFKSNFAAAQPLLNSIITSGKYALATNYVDCFLDSKDNSPERVWEVQFTGGQLGEGTQFITGELPEGFNDKTVSPFTGYSTALNVSVLHYKSYEANDKRFKLSILKGWVNVGTVDTVSQFIIKYHHWDTYTPKAQNDWANNLPILRYTDVVLMNAEALNELGYVANGTAFSQLNSVRARAGLAALTATDLPDKTAFRNAIIKERRVEFAFEGLRWIDLQRWGLAGAMKTQQFAQPENGAGKYTWNDTRILLPIPFDEITRYGNTDIMWQNPGY
jgi:starch-binding outer membrane protein, SusD/RagB family